MEGLFKSNLRSVPLVGRGKVRDLYALTDDLFLIIASDRLSAFDVVLPQPIPGKGLVLTALTRFWMQRFSTIIENHEADFDLAGVLTDDERRECEGRSVVAQRLKALPIEAVVRGYLIGSGWKDYQAEGSVCGVVLPQGLRMADQLPEPIFTAAYKANPGEHDSNIEYEQVEQLIGSDLAAQVREVALRLYREAYAYAAKRGVIIADTKFEFGVDKKGTLMLIDEVLTPDSSRFWPIDSWQPGSNPPSFDKQYVRDYLETLDWNKKAPGPILPQAVIERTADKYREALRALIAS